MTKQECDSVRKGLAVETYKWYMLTSVYMTGPVAQQDRAPDS